MTAAVSDKLGEHGSEQIRYPPAWIDYLPEVRGLPLRYPTHYPTDSLSEMGLLKNSFEFRLDGDAYRVELRTTSRDWHFTVWRDGDVVARRDFEPRMQQLFGPHRIAVPTADGDLEISVGNLGWRSTGCVVERNGELVYRSHDKPFKAPKRGQALFRWLDDQTAESGGPKTPDVLERERRAKEIRPAIYTDIALGVVFFFVAREFGLVTAALTGAAATVSLAVIQPLVKKNLLGGFAVFGVAMALVAAGLAAVFQDDTFVKLRGSIVAGIGATSFLVDGLLGGRYLGKRLVRYLEGSFSIRPQRAAFASAAGALLVILIELPLVFLLTTDQWIWYNSFLDTLVAIPVVLGCFWLASDRRPSG